MKIYVLDKKNEKCFHLCILGCLTYKKDQDCQNVFTFFVWHLDQTSLIKEKKEEKFSAFAFIIA